MERRYCANHPDRLAIGLCVETGIPLCGECSTRYNGVNYSREGLALLHKRMQAAASAKTKNNWGSLVWPGAISICLSGTGYWLFGKIIMYWLGTA